MINTYQRSCERASVTRQIETSTRRLSAIAFEREQVTTTLADAERGTQVLNYGALSYTNSLALVGISDLRRSSGVRLEALRVEQVELLEELEELREELAELS